MPQPIAYNSGNPISGSIEKSTLSFTVEGAPRSERDYSSSYAGVDWYSTIPPQDGKYVIISASNPPMIWVTADETDAELLTTVNGLPDRYNQTLFTDTGSALSWLGSNAYFVSRETPDQVDADSILLSMDAGQLSSYPREGTILYDLSGYARNGTLTNGPTFDSNGAIEFDGVDDYIITSPNIFSSITSNLTMECTFQRNSGRTIINYGTAGNGAYKYFNLESPSSNLVTVLSTFNNNVVLTGTTPISTNTWYQGAVTYNGSTVNLYVNGKLENSTSATGNIRYAGDPSLNIGRKNEGNGEYISGKVSSTKVYNRALSSTEIKQNYYGGPIVTDGLVFAVDAGNLVSYESGSTTTYSLTGSLSGSLINGVGYNPQNGGTWTFDGVDDYIDLGDQSLIENDFCISIWVEADVAKEHFYFSTGYSNAGSILIFSDGIWINSSSTDGRLPGAPGTNIGSPMNITVTRTGGEAKWYKNGIEQGSLTYSGSIGTGTRYTIGYAIPRNKTSAYLQGKFYSLYIYDKGLTPSEVFQNYSATKQKYLF